MHVTQQVILHICGQQKALPPVAFCFDSLYSILNKKLLLVIDGWNESLYIELSSVVELATRAKILSYHTILNVYP